MSEAAPNVLAQRVQERMSVLGLNPFATAKIADLKPGYVHDILRGKVKSPGAKYLRALARALETSSAYLLGETERPVEIAYVDGQLMQSALVPTAGREGLAYGGLAKRLPIRHELAAMVWRNATEVAGKPLGHEVASIPLELESRDQWFELVRDDSMSTVAPRGSLVHVVEVKDNEIEDIQHGDIVVLVKHLIVGDGEMHLVERSLRRINHRLPDLGLWFYELASGDEELDWTDEVFREETRPVPGASSASEDLAPETVDVDPAEKERFDEFIRIYRERRPKVVGKVIRAVVPLHRQGGFGFAL